MRRILFLGSGAAEFFSSLSPYLKDFKTEIVEGPIAPINLRLTLPDLILFFQNSSDDGIDFCHLLRASKAYSNVLFMIFSHISEVKYRCEILLNGCDDYIVLPRGKIECIARIRSQINRLERMTLFSEQYQIDVFQFDRVRQAVFVKDGQRELNLKFTPSEFKLFAVMCSNPKIYLSAKQLYAAIMTNDRTYNKSVYTHISSMRKKLRDLSGVIHSNPSLGYTYIPLYNSPFK